MYKKTGLLIKFYYYKLVDKVHRKRLKNLKFNDIQKSRSGGYNEKFIVSDDNQKKWIIKFCKNTLGKVPDICEREETAFLFGRLLGVSVPQTRVSTNLSDVAHLLPQSTEFISNKFVLVDYIYSKNLKELIQSNKQKHVDIFKNNINNIGGALVFYHWIGDEDRGLEDVLIQNKKVFFIDHGLTGPGKNNKLRGAHPYPEHYNEENILKKCHYSKESLADFIFKDVEIKTKELRNSSTISLIEKLPEFIISFYAKELGLEDSDHYKNVLINRQKNIRQDFNDWLNKIERLYQD